MSDTAGEQLFRSFYPVRSLMSTHISIALHTCTQVCTRVWKHLTDASDTNDALPNDALLLGSSPTAGAYPLFLSARPPARLGEYEKAKAGHFNDPRAYANAKGGAAKAADAYAATVKAHCDTKAVHAAAVKHIGHSLPTCPPAHPPAC